MVRQIIGLIGVVLLVGSVSAQDGGWTVTLTDLSGVLSDSVTAVLSPDGTQIAFSTGASGALCLMNAEPDAESACTDFPDRYFGFGTTLAWTVDGASLTFHEEYTLALSNSDIWRFDVATRTFTNLTDDGVYGLDYGREDLPYNFDGPVVPGLDDGWVYFIRVEGRDDEFEDLPRVVRRVRLDGSDVDFVRSLTNELAPLSQARALALDETGLMAMAVPVFGEALYGVWVMDVETKALDMLFPAEKYTDGLPGDVLQADVAALTWLESDLLVDVYDAATRARNYYRVDRDPDDQEYVPLLDYDLPPLSNALEDERQYPSVSAVSADNTTLFYATFAVDDAATFWALSLEDDTPTPVELGTVWKEGLRLELAQASPAPYLLRVAENGRVLMGSYVFTFERG